MLAIDKQNKIIGNFAEKHVSLYMAFFEEQQKEELKSKKEIFKNILNRTEIIDSMEELSENGEHFLRKHLEDTRHSFAVSIFKQAKQKMIVLELIDFHLKHNKENINLLTKESFYQKELQKLLNEKEVLERQGTHLSLLASHNKGISFFKQRIEEEKSMAVLWKEFSYDIYLLKEDIKNL